MPSKKPSPTPKLLTVRMQPIRATQPFQLLQGNPARKSPSSSPTPRSTPDARVSVRNWWPSDHRSSPDRNERKSPSSPSIKVPNRRSPSPSVRKAPSLDLIAGPYLTGQWPRDFLTPTHQHAMRDKTTQTPDWSSDSNKPLQMKSSSKSSRPSTIADPDFKQMRKQLQKIAKRSNDKKARAPPVHGNHSALHQLPAAHPRSNPISIGANQAFGRIPRRQNSIEALNKEIEFISNSSIASEPKHWQGITPPDGRRAPPPRSSTRTMETQTPQDIPVGVGLPRDEGENAENSPFASPVDQQALSLSASTLRSSTDPDAKEYGVSPFPKYAFSPRPNNSYVFKREPPEGAESVKPFKEMDTQQQGVFTSCPDVKKINFNKSTISAFTPLAPMQAITILKGEQSKGSVLQSSTLSSKPSAHSNDGQTVKIHNNFIPIVNTGSGDA